MPKTEAEMQILETRERILNMIQESIRNVDRKYFMLKTIYKPNSIVRERVFCYELYHQIRIHHDNNTITLNGEIDKAGHRNFKKQDRKNPDFVFHIPGQMEGNTAVVEVKGKLVEKDVIKDFNTLTLFVKKYDYKFGIFILYNHSLEELKKILIKNQCKIRYTEVFDKIDIISAVNNETITRTTLLDLFGNQLVPSRRNGDSHRF